MGNNANHGNSFGNLFKGLGDLIARLGDLNDRVGELSKSGEFSDEDGKLRGVYGFSVKVGIGESGGVTVEPFGNIKQDEETGKATVTEIREPIVDVFAEDDHVLVIAEMPGVDESDLSVEVEGDILTISSDAKGRKYHKELLLPRAVTSTAAEVSCNNGVVEIRLR